MPRESGVAAAMPHKSTGAAQRAAAPHGSGDAAREPTGGRCGRADDQGRLRRRIRSGSGSTIAVGGSAAALEVGGRRRRAGIT